ncbi:hypothetical protein TIFTF001_024162 [Ficus carica]|uniref:Uncharacterized protein n=1 Tax=Ficus carica TaxID=3494 RepID=A0AA88DEG4_FICCA|nr:hypothetical protein TIFTF001_024162 [Ficus carica]
MVFGGAEKAREAAGGWAAMEAVAADVRSRPLGGRGRLIDVYAKFVMDGYQDVLGKAVEGVLEDDSNGIDDRRHPTNGNFALETLQYREYGNRGPGAATNSRIHRCYLPTSLVSNYFCNDMMIAD